MVSTIKFSEFGAANLNNSTNKSVGLSGGANASTEIVVRWTTSTRPSAPFNGILGYNTDLSQYEYWDSVTMMWFQLGTGDTGTVTLVDTGTGLTGGPITNTGTISFAAIAANSLWANTSGIVAVPSVTLLTDLVNEILPVTATARQMLQSQVSAAPVWSTATWPATTTINQILYSSSNNVVGEIATAANAVMSTSAGGLPGFSTTLPSNLITTDPVLTQGIATKHYVDQTALNGTSVYAASAGSLGTVTQAGAGVGATLTNAGVQAALDLDGVAPPVGVNVLIKDTAVGMTAANEGIYTVTDVGSGATNWVLTRATGYDTATEINNTGLILVQNGSTLAGTAWYNAATIVTVDTTAFSFSQFGNIIFPVTLAQGGTSASLVASDGGIFYSNALTGAILAGTATAGQIIRSGASSAPSWSTATYPDLAGTTGNIITSDGTNFVSSAPSAQTITDDTTTNATMYPTWVTASSGLLPLKVSSTKLSFNPSTGTMTLVGALSASTGVTSSAGLNLLAYTYTASAVNYLTLANSVTTVSPSFTATGTDADIGIGFQAKGTGQYQFFGTASDAAAIRLYEDTDSGTNYVGWKAPSSIAGNVVWTMPSTDGSANFVMKTDGAGVLSFTNGSQIAGTATNDDASAGNIGEYISSSVLVGSAVSLTTATPADITSISLTAGDWDVSATFITNPNAATTTSLISVGISQTSATFPTLGAENNRSFVYVAGAAGLPFAINAGSMRISLGSTTTIYLVGRADFAVNVMSGYGFIGARRAR